MKKAVCIFLFILGEIFLVKTGLQAQKTSIILNYSFNPVMKGFDGKTALYGNYAAFPLLVGISVSPVKVISLNIAAGYRIAFLAGAKVAGSKKQPFDIKENIGMGGIRCEAGLSFNF